ncbi:MAG TPA: hypothetical protein PK648_05060 [Verrucomicrobiales bacterium]|nr:hypothetical protein [Verrucomicrobiales bacterium]
MKRLPAFIFVSFLTVSSVRGVNAKDAPAAPVAPAASAAEVKTPETLSGRPLNYNDLARLPYAQLLKIAQSDARAKQDAESYKLRIQSRNPDVKPTNIELFLDVKDKPIVLVVDNDGFVVVPHNKELLESNPDLVANQPRGSLNIFVDLEVPKVSPPAIKDGKVRYQELFRPLVEIQTEMRKVDPTFGLSGQQQFVLEIETGKEPIKITRDFGARTYRPNTRGKVYMIMESYLYEENPEVEIPDKAKMNVLPASPEEIEEIRSR